MGLQQANSILAADTETDRTRVVILFTDGVPTSPAALTTMWLTSAIRWAKVLKGDRDDTLLLPMSVSTELTDHTGG
jgi:Mg-chelatase subunit ChlD